jgi:hypothetical protein
LGVPGSAIWIETLVLRLGFWGYNPQAYNDSKNIAIPLWVANCRYSRTVYAHDYKVVQVVSAFDRRLNLSVLSVNGNPSAERERV